MLVPFLFLAVVHELAHTIVAKLHKVAQHTRPYRPIASTLLTPLCVHTLN